MTQTVVLTALKACGISPKVYGPAVLAIALGLLLLLLGLDVEGRTLIGAGMGVFGLGYNLPTGKVVLAKGELRE